MRPRSIAEKLVRTNTVRERRRIVAGLGTEFARAVARELRAICYENWTSKPEKARSTALALKTLADNFPDNEILANERWNFGIAAITRGKFDDAIEALDAASRIFRRSGARFESANTQVAKLIALASIGRYDEAIKTGRAALRTFADLGDDLAAGKIEMNLSNIVSRRGKHRDAETYCVSALSRFRKCGAKLWETLALNDLANTYSELNEIARAEECFSLALANARDGSMKVTEAEIEASMGNLAIFRGRLNDALRLLEQSRRKYDELKMPHQSAIAELEIAVAYSELNLHQEAFEIFGRTAARLRRLGMRAEEARAFAGLGRSAFKLGELKKANAALKRAAALFEKERNPSERASVLLTEAELELARGELRSALRTVSGAARVLSRTGNQRGSLMSGWLRGETLLRNGNWKRAENELSKTLDSASVAGQGNIEQLCLVSLGRLALSRGDFRIAAKQFRRAASIVESMRKPLPAEEFRMSFLADNLAPYENLALAEIGLGDLRRAFEAIENAKARSLSESVDISPENVDSELSKLYDSLREELNWYYSRIGRVERSEKAAVERAIRSREKQLAEVRRRISAVAERTDGTTRRVRVDEIVAKFDGSKALIEFVSFGGRFGAFVIAGGRIDWFPDLASESEILDDLAGLQFQFGALRYGRAGVERFLGTLKQRADAYLERLFLKLFAPLTDSVGDRDLVVVPSGALNYVPFHALRDGDGYLIERRSISYAPSGALAVRLANRGPLKLESPLLIGFADEKIPLVESEIERLHGALPGSRVVTGDDSSFAAYRELAPQADALHIACHGQFRPDNPMYSSLHLADGFVTVRDICAQRLRADVVTLSACETGLSKVFAGDEIIGLARGFLTAGAGSLVLSLWTVNDAATAELMTSFYRELTLGQSVSQSLRIAQLEFVESGSHPYFWSPFIAIGE